ncbi:hypothetical protein IV203_024399 [Nitzschia inconspicua]|uniref:Uncharacterized protein n=1 Tax=Nitzschia inconspicua TaxID=303405 RepID=A0A9K3PBL5_9STRA|nr:hypothetical protein IV203_024399 [Nitzschia inconspicua]
MLCNHKLAFVSVEMALFLFVGHFAGLELLFLRLVCSRASSFVTFKASFLGVFRIRNKHVLVRSESQLSIQYVYSMEDALPLVAVPSFRGQSFKINIMTLNGVTIFSCYIKITQ